MSQHLSRYGVYNDTSRGWCFIGESGFRGSLIACEQELASFRKTYPTYKYRLAQHAPECSMSSVDNCCHPQKGK